MSQLQITARDLIRRSLILIQVLGQGENPSSQESNDALQTLNEIIDKWNIEQLMIPYTRNIEIPLTGLGKYTIGPTGNVITTRPVNGIDNVYNLYGTNPTSSLPVTIFTKAQFDDIVNKVLPSTIVNYVYYNATFPDSEIYVYPQATGGKLVLAVSGQFDIFGSLDEVINLPSGYIKALRYSLAVELSYEYGRDLPPGILETAVGAKAKIKTTNSVQKKRIMAVDPALRSQSNSFNIYTGE